MGGGTPAKGVIMTERTSMEEIAREVRATIAETLRRTIDEIPLTALLDSGLGIDSLKMVEISAAIEERLQIAMPHASTRVEAELSTVADLVWRVSTAVEDSAEQTR
jgi:acyl carrier protein